MRRLIPLVVLAGVAVASYATEAQPVAQQEYPEGNCITSESISRITRDNIDTFAREKFLLSRSLGYYGAVKIPLGYAVISVKDGCPEIMGISSENASTLEIIMAGNLAPEIAERVDAEIVAGNYGDAATMVLRSNHDFKGVTYDVVNGIDRTVWGELCGILSQLGSDVAWPSGVYEAHLHFIREALESLKESSSQTQE